MILTTTNKIEGKTITKYLGIVSSTTYSSTYALKGMSFSDMFKQDKYATAYEEGVEKSKESAFQKLKTHAENLKANAVVGISIDVEHVADTTYWVVTLAGTAVIAV